MNRKQVHSFQIFNTEYFDKVEIFLTKILKEELTAVAMIHSRVGRLSDAFIDARFTFFRQQLFGQ